MLFFILLHHITELQLYSNITNYLLVWCQFIRYLCIYIGLYFTATHTNMYCFNIYIFPHYVWLNQINHAHYDNCCIRKVHYISIYLLNLFVNWHLSWSPIHTLMASNHDAPFHYLICILGYSYPTFLWFIFISSASFCATVT